MNPLNTAIELMGSVTALSKAINVAQSAPHMWIKRGSVPADQRPAIERVTDGRVPVEAFGPDVVWHRVKDDEWPWNGGRPCIDVTAQEPA